jgi:hypothetical protein
MRLLRSDARLRVIAGAAGCRASRHGLTRVEGRFRPRSDRKSVARARERQLPPTALRPVADGLSDGLRDGRGARSALTPGVLSDGFKHGLSDGRGATRDIPLPLTNSWRTGAALAAAGMTDARAQIPTTIALLTAFLCMTFPLHRNHAARWRRVGDRDPPRVGNRALIASTVDAPARGMPPEPLGHPSVISAAGSFVRGR